MLDFAIRFGKTTPHGRRSGTASQRGVWRDGESASVVARFTRENVDARSSGSNYPRGKLDSVTNRAHRIDRTGFGQLLRQWRETRGKSQLRLATGAGVSVRHLSFIETGRASPSREMVLLLGEALDVPLRDRNALLEAAGFASLFAETPLDAPEMEHVRRALSSILAAHVSNPSIVLNRRCDVLMANEAAAKLLMCLVTPDALGRGLAENLVRLLCAEDGARPWIENWREVAMEMASRISRETSREDALALLADALGADAGLPRLSPARTLGRTAAVALPLRIRKGDLRLDLLSTVTTLGTPLDVTLQEVRIESLFPADAASARVLAEIVGA
jgi:transcriptional regulator with XRE-family HTH domain